MENIGKRCRLHPASLDDIQVLFLGSMSTCNRTSALQTEEILEPELCSLNYWEDEALRGPWNKKPKNLIVYLFKFGILYQQS